jgi:hypothetical protein
LHNIFSIGIARMLEMAFFLRQCSILDIPPMAGYPVLHQ